MNNFIATIMPISRYLSQKIAFFVLTNWFLVSCTLVYQTDAMPAATTSTFIPTLILLSTPEVTSHTLDTGWSLLQPGLEKRLINVYSNQNQLTESVHILRLNQNLFRLDIAYDEKPKDLEDWQGETKAVIVVNGGYFRMENDKYFPDGLIIVNGKTIGSSYDNFAGMLAINRKGAELRWLTNKPYNSNEGLLAALQSFPILVKPGGKLGFPEQYEDNLKARRTVIGQDKDGNILLIVASKGYFTLHQLSTYLTESDLNLDIAINLDGGPSSGVVVENNPQASVSAQTQLPIVILAFAR
jgi:uncharacterized protein YigE (DUF2233 family)